MGNTVVADASICYLVSNHDDEIFIIPRQYLEPKLRELLPQLTTLPYGATDDRALEYLSMTPWGGYLKKRVDKYISIEEKVRVLMVRAVGGLPKNITLSKSQIEKADELWFPLESIKISKDFNYQKFGAKQLINFLEAFCWVSKAYSCECLEIGGGRDFEFQIYEKSSLSFFGAKGKVVLLFRWSEFNYISIENLTGFTINTLDKNWGASMGSRGFPKVI